MATGRIVKALSGFYYVQNDDGLFRCRGRGHFRVKKVTPLVGDHVEFQAVNETDGYILKVFERKNELIRPPIANVDQAILVFSAVEPDFSSLLLDRFLVQIEATNIDIVIVISKIDLVDENGKERLHEYKTMYERIGYPVLFTSTKTKETIEPLIPFLEGKVSVIAGQSGVGKSSLLNCLNPELNLRTKEISHHLGRGRHTTRHVELLSIHGGLVADTPGFSSLDFSNIAAEQLSACFREFAPVSPKCKFRGCLHTSEPKCAVKEAVEAGTISEERYDHYQLFLEEIKSQKRRYDS